MMWALIFMTVIARNPIPDYVELYQTRQECVVKIPKTTWYGYTAGYCVPISK